MQEWIQTQLISRGIDDEGVLAAMAAVPREEFVPVGLRKEAYDDCPLPIGYGQTISQPYIVAYMTQLLNPKPGERILEIGTGSGYQAAILAHMGAEVYTLEIVEPLAQATKERLAELGLKHIYLRHADGYEGWIDAAPFDGILVTAAHDHVPSPLTKQLKVGGRLVAPISNALAQRLIHFVKTPTNLQAHSDMGVRFVPLTRAK